MPSFPKEKKKKKGTPSLEKGSFAVSHNCSRKNNVPLH